MGKVCNRLVLPTYNCSTGQTVFILFRLAESPRWVEYPSIGSSSPPGIKTLSPAKEYGYGSTCIYLYYVG